MPVFKTKNENFFKAWSPEMAYVLGFFAADGSMYRINRGTHFIEFQITDGELLSDIQKLLGSNHKITIRNRGSGCLPIYRLQIGSKIFFSDLEALGFMQNKSKILPLPNIPHDFFSHFTRGYFDGDGHVWAGTIHKVDRAHPSEVIMTGFTSGSEKFLSSFKMELKTKASLTGGSLCYSSGAFRLQYATANSERLHNFMYQNGNVAGLIYLERKYKIFQDALASKAMRP